MKIKKEILVLGVALRSDFPTRIWKIRLSVLLYLIPLVVFCAPSAFATNQVYVAQTAAGAANGTDCPDAEAASYFNTSGNWSSTPTGIQIGPDTTVYLCGTFTGTAGQTALTTQGNGTSGHPVIILASAGVQFTAPRWGNGSHGAIDVANDYIVVDGGTNGQIFNTADGTSRTYQVASTGIHWTGNNIIIRNWNIHDIYDNGGNVNTATDVGGASSADVAGTTGPSNVTVCNNTLLNARVGIGTGDTAGSAAGTTQPCSNNIVASGIQLFGNFLDDHNWMIQATGSGITNIFKNTFGSPTTGYLNWQWPTSTYHTDGIILFSDPGSTTLLGNIYNNIFRGSLGGGSPTGYVFCTYGVTGSGSSCNVFNNTFENGPLFFHSPDGNSLGPMFVANNTFLNNVQYYGGTPAINFTYYNNIWSVSSTNWYMLNQGGSISWTQFTLNNNDYFGGRSFGPWNGPGGTYTSLSAWHSACIAGGGTGCDAASVVGDPKLNSTVPYTIGSTSAARGIGTNLTSLCTGNLAPLCSDAAGNARPSSGAWDAGAYQYGSVAASAPVFSPAPGTYTSAQNITMSNPSGAPGICYTADGTVPVTNEDNFSCANGSVYTSAVSVTSTETLKAVAGGAGYYDSAVTSGLYTIVGLPLASTITISADSIQTLNGSLLASGSLCFQATDASNNVIGIQVGGGGMVVTTPFCTPITNGAISSFAVPNPSVSSPLNIRYHITVMEGSRKIFDSPGVYLCNAAGACLPPNSFDFDTCMSTSACVNNPYPIASGSAGPVGPVGPVGPAGPAGAPPASVELTAQSAAIGATPLLTCASSPPAGTNYLLSWNSKVTTAAGTSSTLGPLTVVYTDPDGSVISQNLVAANSGSLITTFTANSTTGGAMIGVPYLINCEAGSTITYALTYASSPANAMRYNLHIRLLAQ